MGGQGEICEIHVFQFGGGGGGGRFNRVLCKFQKIGRDERKGNNAQSVCGCVFGGRNGGLSINWQHK